MLVSKRTGNSQNSNSVTVLRKPQQLTWCRLKAGQCLISSSKTLQHVSGLNNQRHVKLKQQLYNHKPKEFEDSTCGLTILLKPH